MNETKKIIAVLMLLAICLSLLPSCGKSELKVDGIEFNFAYVRAGDELTVRACSSSFADKYENAKIMDYTLSANKKVLTVTGEGGTYTGEYKVYKRYDESVLYEINIGVEPGFASLSEKTLENGTMQYTLILTIKGYYVTFIAEK